MIFGQDGRLGFKKFYEARGGRLTVFRHQCTKSLNFLPFILSWRDSSFKFVVLVGRLFGVVVV